MIAPAGPAAGAVRPTRARRGSAAAAPNGAQPELASLWRRLREHGDQAARERLVLHFAPLVRYVAGRMGSALPGHIDEGDLISYGLMGLLSAIDRFDPARRVRFETYAVTRIKGAVIDGLRTLDWVPRSVRARARLIERKLAELEGRLQREPTDAEMADALDIDIHAYRAAITDISSSSMVALDEMWEVSAGGEPVSLMDVIPDPGRGPEGALESGELRAALADAIARLPEQEKVVVALSYYDGLSLREIGEVLGVTESRASQIRTKAILRLRGRLERGPLTPPDPRN